MHILECSNLLHAGRLPAITVESIRFIFSLSGKPYEILLGGINGGKDFQWPKQPDSLSTHFWGAEAGGMDAATLLSCLLV